MRRTAWMAALALLLPLCAAGCLAGIGEGCKIDSDCRGGLVCFAESGTCRRPCDDDDDCGGTSTCERGACFLPGELSDGGGDATGDGPAGDEARPETAGDPDARPDEPREVPADCRVEEWTSPDGNCTMPSAFSSTFRAVSYTVGTDGMPGHGLDVDGDGATCAPGAAAAPPACGGGVDNALAQLGIMGNSSLDLAVQTQGTMNIVTELGAWNVEGCPFRVGSMSAVRTSGDPGCTGGAGCAYAAKQAAFDPLTCASIARFTDAVIAGDRLTGGAGGDLYLFDAVVVGLAITVPVYRPRIEATIRWEGGAPVELTGVIGGVVTRSEFIGAFEAIPEDQYPEGLVKENILGLFNGLYDSGMFELDFDLDGDTLRESSSIGILFRALPVSVSGMQ